MSDSPLDKPFLKEDGTPYKFKGKPLTVREFAELTVKQQSYVVREYAHTEEQKKKISEKLTGRASTHKGKTLPPMSEEAKEKIRAANIGKVKAPHSEETRTKISNALKGRISPTKGKPSPNKGKPLSEEQKAKISAAAKARWAAKKASLNKE